jgi:hypothetical protein
MGLKESVMWSAHKMRHSKRTREQKDKQEPTWAGDFDAHDRDIRANT